ncbi:DUF1641 domain-containing protein [Sporosarcina sp. 179-K 3D1 HS]|uniref:DUF1641 domain-containing protein n=1 Tax=Sporosarcina sp. 179-K 3D1 HS TaxID=3232169 RepID=UPI00399F140C
MAVPITSIRKSEKTAEQLHQEKLEQLQALITEQDEALQKILQLTGELDKMGVLDAAQAMVQAKEKIAGIALEQVSREPVTHLINHVMGTAGVLSSIEPEVTAKLAKGVKRGLDEAELFRGNGDQVSIFQLLSAINDPDINRALKFGLDFLKGMGKELAGETPRD